jgi:chemotaxis protein methyltransferase CheR
VFSFFKKKKNHVQTEAKPLSIERNYEDTAAIARYFENETGVVFESDSTILKNKLSTFCRRRDIYSFKELLDLVQKDRKVKQELVNALTTNETYFYREFSQIEELLRLIKANPKQNIKILCAPSATGEEPYSIAIAILEATSLREFSIVGIDINSEALQKAKKAVYTQRHISKLDEKILERYFTYDGEFFKLKESVKSKVTFEVANIFDEDFKKLGKFDYVFSRNMLIYFDQERRFQAKKILESMRLNADIDVFFGHADLF